MTISVEPTHPVEEGECTAHTRQGLETLLEHLHPPQQFGFPEGSGLSPIEHDVERNRPGENAVDAVELDPHRGIRVEETQVIRVDHDPRDHRHSAERQHGEHRDLSQH